MHEYFYTPKGAEFGVGIRAGEFTRPVAQAAKEADAQLIVAALNTRAEVLANGRAMVADLRAVVTSMGAAKEQMLVGCVPDEPEHFDVARAALARVIDALDKIVSSAQEDRAKKEPSA